VKKFSVVRDLIEKFSVMRDWYPTFTTLSIPQWLLFKKGKEKKLLRIQVYAGTCVDDKPRQFSKSGS